ncbi:MAG: colanic acid biosynthesis glycosyltransferase WcaL [Phycisphaerales bacterium]|nr:colanic acid biosynthesis glycosyltransferase WcaL [Phycisphaerales bacterium]
MKIGYLIADFPVLSETFVVNDMKGLEALGHEVVAISLGKADPATEGNPNYQIKGRTIRVAGLAGNPLVRKLRKLVARRRLAKRHGARFVEAYHRKPDGMPDDLWQDRLTWDAALEQIDAERCDWIYVQFAMRQLLLGFWASRLLELPLGVTLQAHDIFTNPLAKWFDWTLGQCRAVVTVSQYNREAILNMAPKLDPGRVRVLANGIDIERFQARPHAPHRPFRFAGTGRLVEIKGFHVLIEAVGLLARKRRDFRVSLIGEGPLRPEFERRITDLGIGDLIELMGKRDASFLQSFLPEQDCFVLPCVIARDGNRDGMPLALREGMACGLPAISTRLLGLHETVSPGTGTLVTPDDPADLARAMEDMIDLAPPQHGVIAAAARAKAEAEFSLLHEVSTIAAWMADER